MDRSQILSNTRAEIRRRRSNYRTEAVVCQWIKRFLDESGIDHSGQLAAWQVDYFIASLKRNERYTAADILQARSALHFLLQNVPGGKIEPAMRREAGEIVKIPA
jgi:hypothetical protein